MAASLATQISGWEAASTIATVAATVLALALAVVPSAWRRSRRPKLKLRLGQSEPHVLAMAGTGTGIDLVSTVLLRVEVANVGHLGADGAWLKVLRRWRRDLDRNVDLPGLSLPEPDERWKLVETEPLTMRWSGEPDGSAAKGTTSVAPKQSEFAELATLSTSDRHITICVRDPGVLRTPSVEQQSYGYHRWHLVAGASGAKPVELVVQFRVDHGSWISQVSASAAPVEAEDIRLLRLLTKHVGHGGGS